MKDTNLSEDYIINELPLAKGYQYKHAILRSYDIETYYIADELELEDRNDLFESIVNNSTPLDEDL